MKIELIPAYLRLEEYINQEEHNLDTWKRIMVDPYWEVISKWAPFPENHKMPLQPLNKNEAKIQLEILKKVDWDQVMETFLKVNQLLPMEDDDPMYVAIYPSGNLMPEGIYGTGVWGNIILNINATNKNYENWLPFVYAHEYHHKVWGDYWFCKQGGVGLHGWFIENVIIEGQADAFAESMIKDKVPSWHQGVRVEDEEAVWYKIKNIAETCLSIEDTEKYMFGCEELGIPQNTGYYFGIKIIREYMKRYQIYDVSELLKVPLADIYESYKKV